MSNVIVEEGYPADFHLGISMIFWFIFIIMALSIGTLLILKALRTPLINRKELYIGNAFIYYGFGTAFIIIQVGVFFPNFFIISISLGIIITLFSGILFIYYWEKNLVNLKKIPTIWMIFVSFLALIDLIYSIVFGRRIFELILFLIVILTMISLIFMFILLLLFTIRVMGILRIRGFLNIFSFIFIYLGAITDHPPVVSLLPKIFLVITPVLFIIGLTLSFLTIIGICDGITSYYNQAQICTIHRGKISKGTHIYFCPNCNTIYCQKCYEQVIKKEGCWNCQEGVKPEDEDKWEREAISIIEVEKGFKKKK